MTSSMTMYLILGLLQLHIVTFLLSISKFPGCILDSLARYGSGLGMFLILAVFIALVLGFK